MDQKEEKVITATDVLETIGGIIIVACIFTAIMALIWAQWHLLQVVLTLLVCVIFGGIIGWYIADKLSRK